MTRAGPRTLRLAHRGDPRAAPENTLAAFAAALRIPGCDGLEFDVRVASDGTPVIAHDVTLERIHGRTELVAERTVGELAALAIPTLAAVLAATPARAFLDIELKDAHGPETIDVITVARATPRRSESGSTLRNAVVSSFKPDTLEFVGSVRPGWDRWLNADDMEPETIAIALQLGCSGISANRESIDRGTVAAAARAGLDVAAFTARRTATFARLARLGVVAICVEASALDRGAG